MSEKNNYKIHRLQLQLCTSIDNMMLSRAQHTLYIIVFIRTY